MGKYTEPNVIDFFSGKLLESIEQEQIIRLSPEIDGLSMLYSNNKNKDKLFAMKILCWGLKWNGEVVGMVPWLNQVMPCDEIKDAAHGHFEGYYDPETDSIFFEAPMHKIVELETSLAYFEQEEVQTDADKVIQRIPDNIGTHAIAICSDDQRLTLTEINSWQLKGDGQIIGMIIDNDKVTSTPVLMNDQALYSATEKPGFRYYFQHSIANQLKRKEPDALAAIKILLKKDGHRS